MSRRVPPTPDRWCQQPAAAGLQPGHRLDLLLDGHAAWVRLATDLANARRSIDCELYMLVDDRVGAAFVDALCAASRRGVEVRLVLDAVGSWGLSWRRLLALQRAGVTVRLFRPPWVQWPLVRWLHRDHRKTLVIDDSLAYVLGMNVGENYFSALPGATTWADAGVRVEGPLVAQLGAVFEAGWRRQRFRAPATMRPASGDGLATVVVHVGAGPCDLHRRYLDAVRRATSRVWLAHAYFLPGRRLMRSLIAAARRGLDVRVLVPGLAVNDVWAVALAADHAVGPLLAHGVRMFSLQGRMMHAKFAVVDEAWWTLGSANLDALSRVFNLEANVVGVGAREAGELATYFEQLCSQASEHSWQAWRLRPGWRQWLGRALWGLRAWL